MHVDRETFDAITYGGNSWIFRFILKLLYKSYKPNEMLHMKLLIPELLKIVVQIIPRYGYYQLFVMIKGNNAVERQLK